MGLVRLFLYQFRTSGSFFGINLKLAKVFSVCVYNFQGKILQGKANTLTLPHGADGGGGGVALTAPEERGEVPGLEGVHEGRFACSRVPEELDFDAWDGGWTGDELLDVLFSLLLLRERWRVRWMISTHCGGS